MLHGQLNKFSQPDVLRQRMERIGFSHGREARVNLRGVRVESTTASEGTVYFCNIKQIEVLEILTEGDAKALPEEAVVEGLYFPKAGTHDLLGVILNSNGALQVRADRETQVVRHREPTASLFKRIFQLND